jgi:amino acid transporter
MSLAEAPRTAAGAAVMAAGEPAAALFPSVSGLPVRALWWAAVLEAIAGAVMVIVSMGAMAGEIGSVSIWIWVATAGVGALQCVLIAQLTTCFPERAGGTPQFAYRALRGGSRTLGALSAWCYWFGWTPAIAINLILAATYIQSLVWPGVNVVLLALGIGVLLYTLTSLGLPTTTLVNVGLAALAVAIMVAIAVTPIVRPSAFSFARVIPPAMPAGAGGGAAAVALLLLKWGFVATWTSYVAELSSTLCSEIRDPRRTMRRVMAWSAAISFIAFSALPVALFGLFGAAGVAKDPFNVFTESGRILLGGPGQLVLGVGLIVVLIFGAEAFIIGSSRTIYQMAMDGHLPKVFARVNRRGAPIGSIVWDALVITIMLVTFGTNVVDQVAAANFGYLLVFVLLPVAYLVLRRRPGGFGRSRLLAALAIGLCAFNGILLVFGGWQWGGHVVLVGLAVSLLIVPVSLLTRWLGARRLPAVACAKS